MSAPSVPRWAAALGVGVTAALAAWAWHKKCTAQQDKPAVPASQSPDEGGILPCRPLHWVFKVGDLAKTVEFYERVFGLKVQRHEEFDHGCEATCNGPYSGWWSKTMMSATTEDAFSIELTYNYGISSYELGNDLAGIHVRIPGAVQRAKDHGVQVDKTEDAQVFRIQNPDGQSFFLHDDAPQAGEDPFLFVSLNTANLYTATDYYVRVLGMHLYSIDPTTTLVGYGALRSKIQLVQLPEDVAVEHGSAFGRIAFGNEEVVATHARVVASNDTVINPPITLSTPGKAQVLVSILRDRDGNEICIVDDADFRQLCERKPGDELINWVSREKRIKAQAKFSKAFGQ